MKTNFNKNVIISFVFLILLAVINQYSWGLFFSRDVFLAPWEKLFIWLLDICFIVSAFLFYMNRKNKIFSFVFVKLIGMNSIVLICALIILEMVFGNWFNSNNLNRLNIIKDQAIHYNLQGLYPSENDDILYTRDKWGFRGEYSNVAAIDILTVGGSTTDQRYISDGYTFQDILRKEFQKSDKDVNVVNAGIDGQSTFGHIKNFDWWFPNIPELKVRYFLFFIGVNDFFIDNNNSYDDLLGESLNPIEIALKTKSALYYLYKTITGIRLADTYGLTHNLGHSRKFFTTTNWVNHPALSNYRELMHNRLIAYEERLDILCKKVKSAGAIPIFVTQSQRRCYVFIDGNLYGKPKIGRYNGQLYNGVDYYHIIRMLHEKTKKICIKNSGIFIDLDNELDFDIKIDFYDSAHTTPSGAEKIGKYLYKKLNYLF